MPLPVSLFRIGLAWGEGSGRRETGERWFWRNHRQGDLGRFTLGGRRRRGQHIYHALTFRRGYVHSGESAVMIGVDGLLEEDALVVALAGPLGLDTVVARRLALIALDATLSAGLERVRNQAPWTGERQWKNRHQYILRHPVFVLFLTGSFGEDGDPSSASSSRLGD